MTRALKNGEAVNGRKYRDRINGFEGTAICIADWLHSCRRVTLTAMKDSDIKEYTFDEMQLEPIEAPPVFRKRRLTGGGSATSGPSR